MARVAVLAAVLVGVLPLLVRRVGDPDFFWHLADAAWIGGHHALPSQDLFTFTVAGTGLTDHEWLGELIMGGANHAGGQLAVSLVFGAVTVAGFLLLLQRIRLRPHTTVITAAALGLGALAGNQVWGPRLQMITFAFVCLELLLVDAFLERGGRLLWLMPAVMAVWANLHGGFVIGPVLLAVAASAELLTGLATSDGAARTRARTLALVTGASVVGSVITPYGPGGFTYAVRTQFSSVQEGLIAEWRSPDFHSITERGLEAGILLLLLGLALSRGARLWDLACACIAVVLALQSVRHVALFVALVTPLLAWQWASPFDSTVVPWLRRRLPAPPRGWPVAVAAVAAVVSIAALAVLGRLLNQQAAATRANYPAAAADYLAANPTTGSRIFDLYGWGGYLANRFYPAENRRLYVYEEADHMGDAVLTDYLDIVDLRGDWRSRLDGAGVDMVVFPPDTPLTSALADLSGWRLAYSDAVADVFVRSSA